MICETFKEAVNYLGTTEVLYKCIKCGKAYESVYEVYKELESGKIICSKCTYEMMDKGVNGIYPRETGMGPLSLEVLIFDDWKIFFKKCPGDWAILNGEKHRMQRMIECGPGYNTARYTAILDPDMIRTFPGPIFTKMPSASVALNAELFETQHDFRKKSNDGR